MWSGGHRVGPRKASVCVGCQSCLGIFGHRAYFVTHLTFAWQRMWYVVSMKWSHRFQMSRTDYRLLANRRYHYTVVQTVCCKFGAPFRPSIRLSRASSLLFDLSLAGASLVDSML